MTDITVAVDQAALSEAFGALIEIFQFDFSKTTEGDVRFGIKLQCHLERGNFALHGPDPSKYPPAEPEALRCEPLKAACAGSLTRPRLS